MLDECFYLLCWMSVFVSFMQNESVSVYLLNNLKGKEKQSAVKTDGCMCYIEKVAPA